MATKPGQAAGLRNRRGIRGQATELPHLDSAHERAASVLSPTQRGPIGEAPHPRCWKFAYVGLALAGRRFDWPPLNAWIAARAPASEGIVDDASRVAGRRQGPW